MPDRHRRVHARVSGNRRGRLHPFTPSGGGALTAGQHARRSTVHALGQRTGVRQPRHPGVDLPGWHRNRPERPWQALAERRRRKLQRQAARRVSVAGVVQVPQGGCRGHRSLAAPLQHGAPPQQPGLPHTPRIQAAQSPHSQPSCLTGMNGSKKPSRSEVPDGACIGHIARKTQAQKAHEGQTVGDLELQALIGEGVHLLQDQHLGQWDGSPHPCAPMLGAQRKPGARAGQIKVVVARLFREEGDCSGRPSRIIDSRRAKRL